MMKTVLMSLSMLLGLAVSAPALAQASPVGLWKTIDDETKREKAYVRIAMAGGVLTGRIEKLLDPAEQDAKCEKCEGAKKDQKVAGMVILEGVRREGSNEHWDGGTILDPNNGKTYRVRLLPKDGGKALDVRGYIGAPMLGRTQTWIRLE